MVQVSGVHIQQKERSTPLENALLQSLFFKCLFIVEGKRSEKISLKNLTHDM